jgi:hypothetical protein
VHSEAPLGRGMIASLWSSGPCNRGSPHPVEDDSRAGGVLGFGVVLQGIQPPLFVQGAGIQGRVPQPGRANLVGGWSSAMRGTRRASRPCPLGVR